MRDNLIAGHRLAQRICTDWAGIPGHSAIRAQVPGVSRAVTPILFQALIIAMATISRSR
jgi:hypothetical protein